MVTPARSGEELNIHRTGGCISVEQTRISPHSIKFWRSGADAELLHFLAVVKEIERGVLF
jgi:hypothetical protein